MLRSEKVATLLVMMTISLLSKYMKSAKILDLTSLSSLLILKIYTLDFAIIVLHCLSS